MVTPRATLRLMHTYYKGIVELYDEIIGIIRYNSIYLHKCI